MTTYDLVPATDYANRTVNGNLNIAQSTSFNVRSLGTGTFNINDDVVLICDASGGNIILNLPTIANASKRFYIIKKTNLTNLVTIAAGGGETINGSFTFDLAGDVTVEIINDGTTNNWTLLSNIVASVAPTDAGISTRELLVANAGGQNPSVAVTNTEIDIQALSNGTLANGVLGQHKKILIANVTGGSYTLTLGNPVGQSTLLFDTVGQSINLEYTAFGWIINGGSGAIVS